MESKVRPPERLAFADVTLQAEASAKMMERIRGAILAPSAAKKSPIFKADDVCALSGVAKSTMTYRLGSRKDLPTGTLNETGRRRNFTLGETRQWVQDFRKEMLRPEGAEAITISIANFKGGTTKTTTAMTLAQGLTLLGHKVLMVDADPQASATTFFGILPDVEIDDTNTIFALVDGSQTSIRPMIRPTYWEGLDLVPASASLFGAEFLLPAMQNSKQGFEFWSVLDLGINDVRTDYDVIIIDTPPALSYITINALMASNGIIMPLPPQTLDYASANQFWGLFAELSATLMGAGAAAKKFDFINILLSRVERSPSSDTVRAWINNTYGDKVLPLEIPKTSTAGTKSAEFGTVYDFEDADLKDRTYKRAREAYDLFVNYVDAAIRTAWSRQLIDLGDESFAPSNLAVAP
ncbi:AAA family ATPase [Variovorax saccharolyticus]|uniref:AAA family ATPase n=1 Tax=Variovorax saccharolyticus TaxID=3053516 RepID=UPI0025752839|nr:AAA family ATPase [Variovorax sp. J31P216]MDM0029803.1 AAA family ATPase [Variovorax sp. J31P216]